MQPKGITLPPHAENLAGQTFNRLTAIELGGRNRHGQLLWIWQCTCGNLTTVAGHRVKSGHTKSCGCFERESFAARVTTHGATVNHSTTPEYNTWCNMIRRCTDPRNQDYDNYGQRGITVCERWRSFADFYADMGEKPTRKHSLERVDNNKGYSPENCAWATQAQQTRNTRQNRWLTLNGRTMCLSDWAKELNLHPTSLNERLERWPIEKALTTPSKRKHSQT